MDKAFTIQKLVGIDEKGKSVHQPVEVPDGMWVCSAGTRFSSTEEWDEEGEQTYYESEEDSYAVAGDVKPTRYITERNRGSRIDRGSKHAWATSDSLLVADQPFGVIHTQKTNGELSPFYSFRAARQVHRGELGRGPVFARPRFAREASPLMPEGHVSHVTEKPVKKRDIRRGRIGWARLDETAAFAKLAPEELLRGYYPFADSQGRGLHAIPNASWDDIHGKVPSHGFTREFYERDLCRKAPAGCIAIRLGENDLPVLLDRDPSRVWLRRGFVLAVLCLRSLGYEPGSGLVTH